MKYSTACAKYVKLESLGACSLKEIFENICFEMVCAQCNAMQLIHWNTFESKLKTINNVNDLDQAV